MPYALYIFGAIVIVAYSIILHEVAHGAMAFHLGDDTAQSQGRLTLNPIPHIDFFGTILLPLIMSLMAGVVFGWAKPVPYNPFRLRGQYGELKVALAGPATNIALAAFFALFMRLYNGDAISLSPLVVALLTYGVSINIWLAIFNLVPIPPLDGSKILFLFIPKDNFRLRMFLERYGIIVLVFFIFIGIKILFPIADFLINLLLGI